MSREDFLLDSVFRFREAGADFRLTEDPVCILAKWKTQMDSLSRAAFGFVGCCGLWRLFSRLWS